MTTTPPSASDQESPSHSASAPAGTLPRATPPADKTRSNPPRPGGRLECAQTFRTDLEPLAGHGRHQPDVGAAKETQNGDDTQQNQHDAVPGEELQAFPDVLPERDPRLRLKRT